MTTPETLATTPWKRVLRVVLIVGAMSAVLNLMVYFVGKSVFNVPFLMPPPGTAELSSLPVSAIAFASFVPAVGAALLLMLLARFTGRARLSFLVIAVIFLIVSFAGPSSLLTDDATKLWLDVMHIVSAAAITGGYLKMLPRDGSPV